MMNGSVDTIDTIDTTKHSQWVLTYCPNTNKEVIGQVWKRFPVFEKQMIWWRCPACNGWHIMMVTDQEKVCGLP